ncbi:MAG: vitamin K epoxide reductase family protein [Bdellovibrionales bacterium]
MKLKIAFLLACITIGLHTYLTFHYYDLNFGIHSGTSICNLNSTFNCDTSTASSYSSLLGIPLALWGAVTNIILTIILGIWILGWTLDPNRTGFFALLLAATNVVASIVMGSISVLAIGSYCLFCMGTYATGFVMFELIRREHGSGLQNYKLYFGQMFNTGKIYLFSLLAIPALAFFINKSYVIQIGADQVDSMIRTSVAEWKNSSTMDLSNPEPLISKGPSNAKMTITEFADFRCSHCAAASHGLKAFTDSHPDIRMNFYVFALDGTCNEAIPQGDGISCFLAREVYCSEKLEKKGWAMLESVFSRQLQINSAGTMAAAQLEIDGILQKLKISIDQQKSCVDSADTQAAIRAQSHLGANVNIHGTPTIFINNKKMERGQLLPVLEAVYKDLMK